jgi:hypothetical protein
MSHLGAYTTHGDGELRVRLEKTIKSFCKRDRDTIIQTRNNGAYRSREKEMEKCLGYNSSMGCTAIQFGPF